MFVESHLNSLFLSVSYAFNNCLIDSGDNWIGVESVDIVLLTHAHFDHIYGLNELLKYSPEALAYTNDAGREMLLNAKKNLSFYHETPYVFDHPEQIRVVNDSDAVSLGNGLTAKAVFTPGHNPSCITWVVGDAIFTGDSLIPGLKTVTNLPGGDKNQAVESEKLIMELAKGKIIYPGHKV